MDDCIRPEIRELANRGNITFEEYELLRLNSYEQELLYPVMTDSCLFRLIEEVILPNCSVKYRRGPAITYDESLIHNFVPILLERLRKRSLEAACLESTI